MQPGPFVRAAVATIHGLASLVSLALFVGAVIAAGVALNP